MTSTKETTKETGFAVRLGRAAPGSVPGPPVSHLAAAALIVLLGACDGEDQTGPGPGQPPSVEVSLPADGSVHVQGEPIAFEGSADDLEEGPLAGSSLVWTSDVDGELNTGTLFTRGDLSVGAHVVTLTATDSEGQQGSASVEIGVEEPPPDEDLDLLPTDWRMPFSAEVRFQAEDEGQPVEATWLVEGIEGGSEEVGTIGEDGLYRAPASVPATNPVTVRAVTPGVEELTGSARVEIVSETEPVSVRWTEWHPKVVAIERSDPLVWEVAVSGHPSAITLDLDLGGTIDLQPIRTGTYGLEVDPQERLEGYESGDLHQFVGFLEVFEEGSRVVRGNVFLNVKDGTVSQVTATRLAHDVQATTHLVNIRWPDRLEDRSFPHQISRRFYDFFPDDFDFLTVVEPVNYFNNRSYFVVSRETTGLGAATLDRTADHGSGGRLKGRIRYPLSFLFDLGETNAPHEIGHQWMVFLDNEGFGNSGSHWPVSSMARGVMGFSGFGGQGSPFPFEVVHVEGSTYELQCAEPSREFNDIELYLMGLLPREEVGAHVIFEEGMEFGCGARGTATPFTIDDLIAVNGERDPPAGEAQTEFRLGAIVLSFGRLLDEDEISFFHHMAERGEAREELHFTSGFLRGTTKPFFVATGGRATLSTRVQQ